MAAPTISFTRGVPPDEVLEAVAPLIADCLREVLATNPKQVLQYGLQSGHPKLRLILAEQYRVDASQVIVGNGSLQLLNALAATLIENRRETVFIELPSYDRAIETFQRWGADVIGIPVEDDGISTDILAEKLQKYHPRFVYVIPDFQNPTGATMSLTKRHALVGLAREHHFIIIEDIPYRQLRYRGEELPMLRELSPDYVVTISSYSKLIAPGLRVGYAIAEPDLIHRLTSHLEKNCLSPVLITQAAVARFIDNWLMPDQIAGLRLLYTSRMQAMQEAIAEYLPDARTWPTDGGFFMSVYLPQEADVTGLVDRAAQKGLHLTQGSGFFPAPLGSLRQFAGFVRFPFSAVSVEQIHEGISLLATLI